MWKLIPWSSTHIKDAGIAIRNSRGRILFYTAGSGNGLEGVDTVARHRAGQRLDNPFEKKNTFSILLRRPRAQARARPRAQAPAKKDGKYTLAAEKIIKNAGLGPFGAGYPNQLSPAAALK